MENKIILSILTEDEIAAKVLSEINSSDAFYVLIEFSYFGYSSKLDFADRYWLIRSLPMFIRNTYGLWGKDWTPEVHDNVDYSPDHPDEISHRIMNKLCSKILWCLGD